MKMKSEIEVGIKYIVLANQDLKDISHRRKREHDLTLKEISINPASKNVDDLLMKILKKE